jgi:ribosomal protein S6--L-glutamate ligase
MHIGSVLNYTSFLNESKSNSDVKIVILTGRAKGSSTTKSFEQVCKERGIECYVVDVNNTLLEKVYNGHLIIYKGQRILIDPDTTAIIPRRGVIENSHTKRLFAQLEKSRYFITNSLDSINVCENKYITAQILEEHGLPVPKYSLVPDETFLDTALDLIGGEFPLILKLISGTQGIGVSIVDSYASLKSVYQTIKKLNPQSEILIQQKIDSDYDIRIQTLVKKFNPLKEKKGNKVILGSMMRKKVKNDFRTNYSLGGEVDKYELKEDSYKELMELAFDATTAVGCHWSGVDIIIDKKTKKPYILEVNSSPGTEGISKVLGEPIVSKIVDYVTDKSNWSYYNLEVGYLEQVEIPGLGNLVAKFDTGNSSKSCSIHADKMEEKDGKLIWTVMGKTFVNDIIDYSKTEVGHVMHERPIIKMDVNFNDVLIKDVRVSPTNRKNKTTPLLMNRAFMRRVGIVVNANKAFVVTEEPEDFKPAK